MKEINNLYRYYFNNPFIGITVCDKNGVCIDVNDVQTKIVGLPKEDFIGKHLDTIVSENKLSSSATLEVLKSKSEVNMTQTSAAGNTYEVKAIPIYGENNEIEYVVNYILDSTITVRFKSSVERLENENMKSEEFTKLLSDVDMGSNFVFASKIMKEKSELAVKIAPTDATVLITGPSGAGKEIIADLIHENSNRTDKPYIKLNCAALPEHLLESELFGYEAGAFTGGRKEGSIGLFEAANGGTLLLDEISEMSISLQAKLLRVLQDQEVRRIGGDRSTKVDIRIIASTNAPLIKLIEEKKFREDLYYRLNVISIYIPGLNQRKDDIPGLAVFFLNKFNKKYNLHKTINPQVINHLQFMDFPGNVRELQNIMERSVLQSENNAIKLRDILEIRNSSGSQYIDDMDELLMQTDDIPLKNALEQYERQLLKRYIKKYRKISVISKKLNIDRSTLTRKIKKYKLEL